MSFPDDVRFPMSLGRARRLHGQLPAELTGFVGREVELTQLAALLAGARLVTVTGPAGIGKTRLALRAAARAAPRYADGTCLVELSALRDPALLPAAVAAALGLPQLDASARPGAVLDHLRDRSLLLILDTCEHLTDACARFAAALLTVAANVTVLATSRQPLDMPGEHSLQVPPLPVPEPGRRGTLAPGGGDAVELFAQRAASVLPGFAVTPGNRADVITLCRRLDGIPLAIELAAVRLRALPLKHMAERLDDRFRVLTGGRRTALPRHRTLRAAIDWSYQLCTPAERTAWARLSVFAGSFDIAAAEDVCAGGELPRPEVIETVVSLVDKSVLLREAPAGAGSGDDEGTTRYRLLGTFREFGAGHLAGSGAEAAVRDRYVARYLALAETFSRHFTDDQLTRYRLVHREHANVRAAFGYALARPETDESAAALAVSLAIYWHVSGQLREGKHWLDKVVDHYPARSRARARALAVRAFLTATQGDAAAARADAEAAIAMAADSGDTIALARGYLALHRVLSWTGDPAGATATAALAVPVLEAAGDTLGLVQLDIQDGLAHLPASPGLVPGICARGRRRLPPGEVWAASYLLGLEVLAQFRQGDYEPAAAAARRALTMKHELGDIAGIACALGLLGFIAAAQHRYDRASWLLGAATPLWEQSGYRYTGNPMLEELHRESVRAALDSLGRQRYTELRDRGAAGPLDAIIALALADASEPDPPCPARVPGPLTSRELEIAALVTSGLSNREIAERAGISKRTVDAHVDHIFGKLGISSRVQLTMWLKERLPRARESGDRLAPPRYP